MKGAMRKKLALTVKETLPLTGTLILRQLQRCYKRIRQGAPPGDPRVGYAAKPMQASQPQCLTL